MREGRAGAVLAGGMADAQPFQVQDVCKGGEAMSARNREKVAHMVGRWVTTLAQHDLCIKIWQSVSGRFCAQIGEDRFYTGRTVRAAILAALTAMAAETGLDLR